MSQATAQIVSRLKRAIVEVVRGNTAAAEKQVEIVRALIESERDVETRAQRVEQMKERVTHAV